MKNRTLLFASAMSLVLALQSTRTANATTYDFSYLFTGDGAGSAVTGSFTGYGSINDITVTSVLSLLFNGVEVGGPLYFSSYNGPVNGLNYGPQSNFTLGKATVSADSSKSNFLFGNTPVTSSAANLVGKYFYVIQPWYNPSPTSPLASQGGFPGLTLNTYNGQFAPGNFSVSAVSVPGPVAGTGVPVLIALISGYSWTRLRRSQRNATSVLKL